MTPHPRPYRRAEAERLLDYADEWAAQAEEPMPEAGELSCLAHAAVHALLAIHDALAKPCDACAKRDAYAAREAEQREAAEPDPRPAGRGGRWAWPDYFVFDAAPGSPLTALNASDGPLTFAPEPPPDAARDDLSASEGGSGAEERGEAEDTVETLLCPECGHDIDSHGWEADYAITCCLACDDPADCRKAPSDIARALIRRAVEQAGGRRG